MDVITLTKTVQIILGIAVIVLTLVQSKGGGLSSTFGGSFTMYRSKRGAERMIFISTIFTSVLLVANSLVLVSVS